MLLLGSLVLGEAVEGEQQRPSQQLPGILAKPMRWLLAA